MKKRMLWTTIASIFVVSAFIWYGLHQSKNTNELKIGVSLYIEDDAFVNSIVAALQEQAAVYEQMTEKEVMINIACADGSQRQQNKQIEKYIALQYDVICVNLVDRTNAAPLIDQVKAADIPLIFFNREPVKEDILRQKEIYYVGTDAKDTAKKQGQAVLELYEKYAQIMDKNKDGVLQYVILEGEMGHQDTELRCEYVLQTLENAGIAMEKLDSDTADWLYTPAEAIVEEWTKEFGQDIELVLSNNDEMALGAVDALEAANIQAAIFGIDATPAGKEAVQKGRMWATVDCNAKQQGEILLEMAMDLAEGKTLPKQDMKEERYVRVPVTMVLAENIK